MATTRLMVLVLAAGCGGGNDAMIDALIPHHEYNLTCLNMLPTTAEDPIGFSGTVFDVTTSQFQEVPDTLIEVSLEGSSTPIATATSDAAGKYVLSIATGGTPPRLVARYAPDGLVKTLSYVNVPASKSATGVGLVTTQQSRIDTLAAALNVTPDATRGTVEVAIEDCSGGTFPGATVTVADAPAAPWADYVSTGQWLPRATTVTKPTGWAASIAATTNLEVGTHTLTITEGTTTIGPITFTIEAAAWTHIFVTPGWHP